MRRRGRLRSRSRQSYQCGAESGQPALRPLESHLHLPGGPRPCVRPESPGLIDAALCSRPRESLKVLKLTRFMKRESPITRLAEERSSRAVGPRTQEEGRGRTPLNLGSRQRGAEHQSAPVQTDSHLWPPEATQLTRLRPGQPRPLGSSPCCFSLGPHVALLYRVGGQRTPRPQLRCGEGAFTLPPGMGLNTVLPTSLTLAKPIPGSISQPRGPGSTGTFPSLFTC